MSTHGPSRAPIIQICKLDLPASGRHRVLVSRPQPVAARCAPHSTANRTALRVKHLMPVLPKDAHGSKQLKAVIQQKHAVNWAQLLEAARGTPLHQRAGVAAAAHATRPQRDVNPASTEPLHIFETVQDGAHPLAKRKKSSHSLLKEARICQLLKNYCWSQSRLKLQDHQADQVSTTTDVFTKSWSTKRSLKE